MKNLYRCQIFTPDDKVEKLLDTIDYKQNLYGKKFLENSCGDGSVLKQVVLRYINDCLKKNISKKDIKSGLENDILAFEIDKTRYNDCINNLNKIAAYYGLKDIQWQIYKNDFLKYPIKQKFSYIAGNPPYINYRDLSNETRSYIKEKFKTCRKGKFDYCYAFIEKSVDCLANDGKLGYLIPSSLFKNVFAEHLRNQILPYVKSIYDFKTKKVFEKALVATSILLCDKNYTDKVILYKSEEHNRIIKISKTTLDNKWIFQPSIKGGEMHKKCKFGDLYNASISIATLSNKAFVVDESLAKKFEDKITKPAKSPRNLAYSKNEKIIFPYQYQNNELKRYSEDEFENNFPQAAAYLKTKKDELNKRNKDNSAKWFEYGRSQALAHLNQEKLLISTVVTDSIKVYKLNKDDIPYAGIYITAKKDYSLDKAKQILCSEHFLDYVNNIGIQASGTSLRITPKDVNNFEFDMEAIG